eukprot:7678086-Pyramimonas_sp.AAC.1
MLDNSLLAAPMRWLSSPWRRPKLDRVAPECALRFVGSILSPDGGPDVDVAADPQQLKFIA